MLIKLYPHIYYSCFNVQILMADLCNIRFIPFAVIAFFINLLQHFKRAENISLEQLFSAH